MLNGPVQNYSAELPPVLTTCVTGCLITLGVYPALSCDIRRFFLSQDHPFAESSQGLLLSSLQAILMIGNVSLLSTRGLISPKLLRWATNRLWLDLSSSRRKSKLRQCWARIQIKYSKHPAKSCCLNRNMFVILTASLTSYSSAQTAKANQVMSPALSRLIVLRIYDSKYLIFPYSRSHRER